MSQLLELQGKIERLRNQQRKVIHKMLDGRSQKWLSEQTNIHVVRLSNCLNGVSFTKKEIEKIEETLLSKI